MTHFIVYLLVMKPTKYPQVFITILNINLFLIINVSTENIVGETDKFVTIPKCTDFWDNGNTESHSTESTNVLATRVTHIAHNSEGQYITLELEQWKSLKCGTDKAEELSVSWKLDNQTTTLGRRNFYDVSNGSSERHSHYYFSETGDFYDKKTGNYYKPDGDYCVQSISDDRIDLRVCAANSDCSSISMPNTFCLPKCCALDETLLFWKRQCIRLPETQGRTPWKPLFYQGPKKPNKLVKSNPNLIYHMAQLPKKCFPMKYNETFTTNLYGFLSSAHVKHPKGESPQEKHHVKLTLPKNGGSGKVQIMSFYNRNRKWLIDNYDNYCVEGFYVKSKDAPQYTGNPENFVIFYCSNEGDDMESSDQKLKSWTYVVVSLLVLIFLLATLLVYLMLLDKHNLHGLTILSYTISAFGSYFFLTIAHLVSLIPNSKKDGPFCYATGVLAHYFYLSSYLWLTVMNFDVWMTFRSIRVVSRDAKEWPKYAVYSAVAFAFPGILIIVFVVIDHVYRDPLLEVPVPDYARGPCFVSSDFRGQYVYTPMAIMLGINIVLICLTMWIFIQAKRQTKKTFTSGGASNAKRYNAKLFGKLFILMGGTYIIDFLTWFYNNKGHKPWPILVLEVFKYITPVALFYLFCMNDKIIGQLREKFPGFMGKLGPVFKMFTKEGDAANNLSTGRSNTTHEDRHERIPMAKRNHHK